MKRLKMHLALLPLLILLPAFTARAEETEIPEEEVVVTATRTSQTRLESPGMTEVITEGEIQASCGTTVAELLAEKGFVVSSNGGAAGAATFRLDGSEATQTLILVNGIPVNSGTMGMVDLSYFPTAGVSKIEVAHGPLSSLYGSNALGGVVNIITDLTGEPDNNFSITYGNTDHGDVDSGQAAITIQQSKYGLALGGGMDDGFRENSETDNYFFMYQYDFIQKKDETLSFYVESMVKKNGLPGAEYSPTPEDDQSDKKHSLRLIGKKVMLKGLWEYKIYGDSWDEECYTYGKNHNYQYRNYGVDAAGLCVWGPHEALLGMNLVYSETDSTDYGKHHLNNTGIFIQDTWSLNERWKLISGLRGDTGSEYSSPVCPKVSLVFLVNNDFSIKFGYGKSFRAPTISDLYSQYGGNPDLEPEQGERYEITGEWRQNIHSLSLNVYRSHLKDGIDWIWVGPTEWDYSAKNFDKINATGVNLNWKIEWNEYLNSTLKYSWIDKANWDSETNSYHDDNYFGENKLALGLNLKYASFRSALNWEYVWDRSEQVDYSTYQSIKMKDYDVLNWNLAYLYNDTITYELAISNLTDEDYEIHYGYPMPGREYQLSVHYRFK